MSYPEPASTTSGDVKGLTPPQKIKPKAKPVPHVMSAKKK